MRVKHQINQYIFFSSQSGKRVGQIIGIYQPNGDEVKYIVECTILVTDQLDGSRKVKKLSYYNLSESEVESM